MDINNIINKKRFSFRFEVEWTSHPDFKDFRARNWTGNSGIVHKLETLKQALIHWNSTIFRNIFRRKRKVITRLEGIQKVNQGKRNSFLYQLEDELSKEYSNIFHQEEMF